MFFHAFFLFIAWVHNATPMDINGQDVSGPLNYGQTSDGVLEIAAGAKLSQSCNQHPPRLCGAVTGGIMSGLYINSGAKLIQDAETNLICGNYTVITLDKGCELSLLYKAQLRPNVDFGGGRIEVYCSAVWSLGDSSYINLDRQSKILVKAPFNLGKFVMIRMEPASTLDIENSLEIKDLVWLVLNKGSLFQINPTSGGAATISSSSDFTLTQVTLDPSAVLIVNGTFTVGNGRKVTMTIASSGSLIIMDRGQFLVEATTFTIGPSSFWMINGSFTLDKSSTFDSGMQSNLTIDGSIDTKSGSLVVGPFSSFVIQGSCTNNGNITTMEFSRLVIGPPGTGNQGTVEAQAGGKLFLDHWSSVEIMGYAQLSGSSLLVGERATASVGSRGIIQLSQMATIMLDSGASIAVPGQYKSEGGMMHLGTQAATTITGSLAQDTQTSIQMAEGAEFVVSSFVSMQNKGIISMGKGAFMTISGQTEINGGTLSLAQQASATLQGQLDLFAGSMVTVGSYSNMVIPVGTIVNVSPKIQIKIGQRSQVIFSSKLFCTLTQDFVVMDFKNIVVGTNTNGIQCFQSGQ